MTEGHCDLDGLMTPDISASIHEAAHCVVANRLGLRLRSVSIEHDGSGTTTTLVPQVPRADAPHWAQVEILVSMSGAAAEVVLLGRLREDIPDHQDRANQLRHAEALAPDRKHDWEGRCWRAACAYVEFFKDEIERLADELMVEKQLNGWALTRTIERAAR